MKAVSVVTRFATIGVEVGATFRGAFASRRFFGAEEDFSPANQGLWSRLIAASARIESKDPAKITPRNESVCFMPRVFTRNTPLGQVVGVWQHWCQALKREMRLLL